MARLEYQLIRSERKTLGLQVKRGEVVVRAPHLLSNKQIHAFVESKMTWLMAKVAEQTAQGVVAAAVFIVTPDTKIWLLGEQKRLSLAYQKTAQVQVLADEIKVYFTQRSRRFIDTDTKLTAQVKKQLSQWYKQTLLVYLKDRIPELSHRCQLEPKSYQVRQYKARWGSCNSRGELSFNLQLMMLPYWVIDYVIIHELCHLTYLNHSPQFWRLVASYCPDYQAAKLWLKQHQTALVW